MQLISTAQMFTYHCVHIAGTFRLSLTIAMQDPQETTAAKKSLKEEKGEAMDFMKGILAIIIFGLVALSCCAQTFDMNMGSMASSWNICIKPLCDPGGTGIPKSSSVTETGTTWPANSLKVQLTGPAYTNLLVYAYAGQSSASYFSSDFYIILPAGNRTANIQAVEYDIFQYLSPYRYMFGSQCVIGATWQIWDALNGHWINTALPCTFAADNAKHHIQWWVHRVDGDTSCSGYPCMYYDMLGIDNVYTQFNLKEPAQLLYSGWTDNTGLNMQIDISGAPTGDVTVIEDISSINFVELGR